MNLSKYSDYKKSNVSWLGEIPSNWSVQSCRGVLVDRNERNDPQINENYLSLMANIGIILYEEKGDVGNKKPEDLGKCKQVYPGDLVINSMNYGIGSYGLSKHRGVCSPVYIVLKPKLEKIEERYAFRILEIKKFQQYAQSFGNGILEHRASISWDILKNIGLPLPPIEEQKAILGFLDNEIEKIDTLVKTLEKLIDLLVEQRQAVISNAVTKGLDPKVKMKRSGVAWLGEIPEHWEVTKIKYIATASNGLTYSPDDLVDSEEGVLVLRSSNIQQGEISLEDNVYVKMNIPSKSVVKSGDILICSRNGSRALIGKNALIPDSLNGVAYGAFMMLLRSDISRYIYWILNSFIFKFQSSLFLTSTINQLTVSDLYGFEVPIPPKSEQVEIIRYLQDSTTQINSLIDKATKSVALLQERRTALISAAVTGQIDVRNYQPKEIA